MLLKNKSDPNLKNQNKLTALKIGFLYQFF